MIEKERNENVYARRIHGRRLSFINTNGREGAAMTETKKVKTKQMIETLPTFSPKPRHRSKASSTSFL